MSLRAYESAKKCLEVEVDGWIQKGYSEEALIEQTKLLSHPNGKQQIHGADDLWDITASVAAMRVLFDNLMDAIHHLEKETGREWYGRPRADRL